MDAKRNAVVCQREQMLRERAETLCVRADGDSVASGVNAEAAARDPVRQLQSSLAGIGASSILWCIASLSRFRECPLSERPLLATYSLPRRRRRHNRARGRRCLRPKAAVDSHRRLNASGDTFWFALAVTPLWHVAEKFETGARLRSAGWLGLTPETVPRRARLSGGMFYFAATVGPWAWRKLRQRPVLNSPPWTFVLASRIIAALDERRSWRRANHR